MKLSRFFIFSAILWAASACGSHYHTTKPSCNVKQTEGGAQISCPDGSNVLVENGTDGADGLDGINGQDGAAGTPGQDGQDSIVEIIDPCGDGTGFDEVLLVLSSGEILAYFEQGNNRFLSVIPDGNYQTTDAQRCNFSVLAGLVTYPSVLLNKFISFYC